MLQCVPGLDKQFAEILVKSSIPDTYAPANIKTKIVIDELEARAGEGRELFHSQQARTRSFYGRGMPGNIYAGIEGVLCSFHVDYHPFRT